MRKGPLAQPIHIPTLYWLLNLLLQMVKKKKDLVMPVIYTIGTTTCIKNV